VNGKSDAPSGAGSSSCENIRRADPNVRAVGLTLAWTLKLRELLQPAAAAGCRRRPFPPPGRAQSARHF